MGSFSCKGWDCKNTDIKIEDEFRTSDFNIYYQGIKGKQLPTSSSITVDKSYFISHIDSLIQLQSALKTYVYKKLYQRDLKLKKPNYYYFSYEEVTFFLSKTSKLPSFKEETKGKLYSHGGIYTGEMRGGFRDGQGTMQWKDGAKYEGQWAFGRPYGEGLFIFPDGDSYKGPWLWYFSKGNENEISGLGVILWKENVNDGYKWLWYKKAICINSPRSVTMTPRNEEKMQQIQEKYLAMKQIYDKNLSETRAPIDNKERKYPDGSYYKGDLQGVKRDGFGKIAWIDGDSYEGQWKDDIQCGWGKNSWKEGAVYYGFFAENLKDGIGKYCWEDGIEYFGEWKVNKMQGVGKYNWNDGKVYLGEWDEGTMQGFGVLMWKDGRKYEGGWHQGKKNGEGVTYYTNGKVSRDVWKNGKIIRPDV